MKKIIAILLSILMLFALTACGKPAEQPVNTTTNPVVDATTADTTPTDTAPEEVTEAQNADSQEPGFVFTFEGVDLTPGEAFDAAALPEALSVFQVPSCAIEGTDNVYSYGAIEVTAFDDGTGEVIYSVYIADANTPTNEGLYIGDTVDHVVAAYGEDYVRDGNQITYQKGNTLLILVLNGEYVQSIDFRWDA